MVELRERKIQGAKCLADILPYCEAEEKRIASIAITEESVYLMMRMLIHCHPLMQLIQKCHILGLNLDNCVNKLIMQP